MDHGPEDSETDDGTPDIALGVKVFSRVDRLRTLLDSVPPNLISRVIIADDGEQTDEKKAVYGDTYGFDTEVLNLEYDAGIGHGRHRIVEALNEEFLLIADPDHVLPSNLDALATQLLADPSIGGVAGSIVEPRQSSITLEGADFTEIKNTFVRYGGLTKECENISDSIFLEYDFIPNAALFRRECLEEYSWDPSYVIGREHTDFYIGHWKRTDWRFGICPNVAFQHVPGGDSEYEDNRWDRNKLTASIVHFRDKWEYDNLDYTNCRYTWDFSDDAFSDAGLLDDSGLLSDSVDIEFFEDPETGELGLRIGKQAPGDTFVGTVPLPFRLKV